LTDDPSDSSVLNNLSNLKEKLADFRKRFWISLGATFLILALSPMIQAFLGFKQALGFPLCVY